MDFSRITIDPTRMAGAPCIRNLRIPVTTVIDMVADGMTEAEILQATRTSRARTSRTPSNSPPLGLQADRRLR
jgi:hypothetical protein